jgi:hypothetical protein
MRIYIQATGILETQEGLGLMRAILYLGCWKRTVSRVSCPETSSSSFVSGQVVVGQVPIYHPHCRLSTTMIAIHFDTTRPSPRAANPLLATFPTPSAILAGLGDWSALPTVPHEGS